MFVNTNYNRLFTLKFLRVSSTSKYSVRPPRPSGISLVCSSFCGFDLSEIENLAPEYTSELENRSCLTPPFLYLNGFYSEICRIRTVFRIFILLTQREFRRSKLRFSYLDQVGMLKWPVHCQNFLQVLTRSLSSYMNPLPSNKQQRLLSRRKMTKSTCEKFSYRDYMVSREVTDLDTLTQLDEFD